MIVLINIDVPDLEAAERFYTAAFRLRVGRRFGGGLLELLAPTGAWYLIEKLSGTIGAGGEPRRYERHWTPIHLDLVVDDLDAAVERAVAAGATIETSAERTSFGRIAMLADPFGHGFCIIEFEAEGYDSLVPRKSMAKTSGRA